MPNILQNAAAQLRGSLRLGPIEVRAVHSQADFELSNDSAENTTSQDPGWLTESRKLIPGEALAAYVSLQPIANMASRPNDVRIVMALAFCVVTILLRWYGTQDPESPKPETTVQVGVVIISTLAFIFLVYATGGQIFWHPKLPDQSLYGQIGAAAIGILGPGIYKSVFSPKKSAATT